MKGVVIGSVLLCVALIGLGIVLATHQSGNGSRVVPYAQQYLDRQQNGGWVKGASNPQVKVEEYGDFQCPACGALEPVLSQALSQTTDYVQFTYRNYPLPQHNKARLAAQAAESAGRQGKFWEMHDLLFSTQQTWENDSLSAFKDRVVTDAQSFGINTEQFRNDLTDTGSVDIEVNKDITKGNTLPVTKTPTLIINGKEVETVPTTPEDMIKLFDASRQPVTP
jgi:protein-disulfide isomerase